MTRTLTKLNELPQSGGFRHARELLGDLQGISNGHGVDLARIERAVREILIAVGEDPDRDGLKKTPKRVARSYAELLKGITIEPTACMNAVFDVSHEETVVLRSIEFHSLCEHHMLPFTGRVSVAYLPRQRVVGVSKLARLVQVLSSRLQVQERLTDQIADAIMDGLNPHGAICIVEATHTCMTIRGARQPNASMVTTAARGVFREDRAMRRDAWAMIYDSPR